MDPRLSPDGGEVAVVVQGSTDEIWIYGISRATFARLNTGAGESSQAPLWTPDGTRIVHQSGDRE